MRGNDIDNITFLNKFNSLNILSTNIQIKEALLPAPDIFSTHGFWRTVFYLKYLENMEKQTAEKKQ